MAKLPISPLTDAQMRFSTYLAVLLATLLPPFVGGTMMAFVGFYPLSNFYSVFLSYSGLYVLTIVSGCLSTTPRILRYIIGLTQIETSVARVSAQRKFRLLPYYLLGAVTLYSIGGALSADFSLQEMGVHNYTLREHIYNQFGLIPVVLITTFPIFFYFTDRLGRYLGPHGICVTAVPMLMKIMMLGIVTPLLIDSLLIGYYFNHTGFF
ncbi:MAG: hypothetical protein D4R48_00185, partial [Nitrosomonadales bacterium]